MRFDVIVVGGGHAGCEAADAAARLGARVALVTMDPRTVGAMSCNPAIGGIGKGHLVREVDAFGGVIAEAADAAAIHYRMLNRSKGVAVQGPRVQADRALFRSAVQARLAGRASLSILAGTVDRLSIEAGHVAGVELAGGERLAARAVVLATGTFLGGVLHLGLSQRAGGRVGEDSAAGLSRQLRGLGFPVARLKTGTPPRLDGRTIDWARIARQPSDPDGWTMAFDGRRSCPQLACGIVHTNGATHDLIRANLDRSPLFSGAIEGVGPRYCPSIEDKVQRFAHRDRHQLFLEPEGLDSSWIYPNGISTSLPEDVQAEMVRTIQGLESCRIVQPGYAVEYDHIDPRSLTHELQCRDVPGFFMVGQVNGTTGYEEAAAQGLVGGLNAACLASDREPILFDRSSSYIGVLIDDLVLQGVTEPYRMLTSRAELRLALRADNAVSRLGPLAILSGALDPQRLATTSAHLKSLDRGRNMLSQSVRGSNGQGASLASLMMRDGFTWNDVSSEIGDNLSASVKDELMWTARYAPYVDRQRRELNQANRDDHIILSGNVDYASVNGLSREMIDRLTSAKPSSLAQAARIRGITPAAITSLLAYARRA